MGFAPWWPLISGLIRTLYLTCNERLQDVFSHLCRYEMRLELQELLTFSLPLYQLKIKDMHRTLAWSADLQTDTTQKLKRGSCDCCFVPCLTLSWSWGIAFSCCPVCEDICGSNNSRSTVSLLNEKSSLGKRRAALLAYLLVCLHVYMLASLKLKVTCPSHLTATIQCNGKPKSKDHDVSVWGVPQSCAFSST